MKRKIIQKIMICFIIMMFPFSVFVQAVDTTTSVVDGAEYTVTETIETNDLPFDIKHQKDSSISKVTNDKYIRADTNAAGLGGGGKLEIGKEYTQQVNFLEIPSNENVKIVPWANIKGGNWSLCSVRNMAHDYEDEHPGWKVIAAINADFFDINGNNPMPYTTSGGLVIDKDTYKVSTGWGALGIDNSHVEKQLIGELSPTVTAMPTLAIYNEQKEIIKEISVDKVNQDPNENEVAVYFPQWKNHNVQPLDVQDAWIVEKADDTVSFSLNSLFGKGFISKKGSQTLTNNQFAVRTTNPEIENMLHEGTYIRVQHSYTGTLEQATDLVGFHSFVMKDGLPVLSEANDYGLDRLPRTIIGKKENGNIGMVVVDGRQPYDGFFGANQGELSAIAQYYGLVDAYQFDGGGSSTMVILKDGELTVMNSPSDGSERNDSDCLLVVAHVPTLEYEIEQNETSLEFNVQVIEEMSIYQDLYVEVGNERKKIENGKVVFDHLDVYQEYSYTFYGFDGSRYVNIVYGGKTNTCKTTPTIEKVIIRVVENQQNEKNYEIECILSDPQTALVSMRIEVGSKSYQKRNNVFVVPFTEVSPVLDHSLVVVLYYNIEKGHVSQSQRVDTFTIDIQSSFVLFEGMKQEVHQQFYQLLS